MSVRIDAHQHFWRIGAAGHEWPTADLPAIHRDFLPADLTPELRGCGMDGTVLVQSQPGDADTDWMLALVADQPDILGVVGWVDMAAPDAPARIAALAAHPWLKGLRPMLQNLPAEWILQPAIGPAIEAMVAHGLVFDALIRPLHLPAIGEMADRHPHLSIVIDHGAKPDIATDDFDRWCDTWADDLAWVAERPNVACKLSGLVTEAGDGWTPADLRPVVQHMLRVFGPDRVLWGSDWPVLLLQADYAEWLSVAQEMVPQAQRDGVFGGNAARIYHLRPSVRPA